MRTSGALKSIIAGITTNRAKIADPRYLKEQINMQTVDDSGLHKRPALELILIDLFPTYVNDVTTSSFVKKFEFEGDGYALMVQYDTTNPFNTLATVAEVRRLSDGTTIAQAWDTANFVGATESKDIDFIEQGDTVWVLNKKTIPLMTTDLRETEETSHIIVTRAPLGGSNITVSWTDTLDAAYSATVVVGTTAGATGTNVVAGQIASAINAEVGDTGVTATFAGSSVAVIKDNSEYANISIEDDDNGAVVAMNGFLNDILDLPRWLAGTQILKIKPEKTSDRGVYYMRSESDTAATAPAVPASDGEFVSGTNFYNPDTTRYNTGVQTLGCSLSPAIGTWTTKPIISAVTAEAFLFRTNFNGTGLHYLQMNACGGGSPIGFPTGSVSRISVRRKSDLSLVFDQAVTVADEIAWGTGVAYFVPINPSVTLSSGTAYYIYINKTSGLTTTLTQVNWSESSAPGENYRIRSELMPFFLAPDDTSALVVNKQAEWSERDAGDLDTAPLPDFIGNNISDLGVFQNRLAVISKDQIITTATDDNLNWFRTTATQVLSTDPVRMRSTAQGIGNFTNLVNHNRDLMVFTPKAQVKMTGDVPITPATAGLPVAATYKNDAIAKPISIGDSVFFLFDYGTYYGVSRYFPDPDGVGLKDIAIPITDHAKRYIAGTPITLLGDGNTGELYLVMESGQIYVCDYDIEITRSEDRRFAWSLWKDLGQKTTFKVLTAEMDDREIQLMLEDSDNDVVQYCTMNTVNDPDSVDRRIFLDFMQNVQLDASAQYTLPTNNPYTISDIVAALSDPNAPEYGNQLEFTEAGGVLTFETTYANAFVKLGMEFRASFKPQTMYITDESGFVNHWTKFRINQWIAHVNQSAEMYAKIISKFYNIPDQFWPGLTTGEADTLTDTVADSTTAVKIAYKQRNDLADLELYSTSHLPWSVTQMEWLGNYASRGRRF